MRQFAPQSLGVVAAVLILGFVAEVNAAAPRGLLFQRRGNVRTPSRPAVVDSTPTIAALNKALKALGATDLDYDGHREKAIAHVGAAIRHLETPNARGKSNTAIDQAATGKRASGTATMTQTASDEHLHKAKTILFAIHHQLKDHASSRGRIRADAEILIAVNEIVAALKPATGTAAAAPETTTQTPATTPGNPAR